MPTLTPSARTTSPASASSIGREWRGRQTYFSADVRNKLIYNYHQTPQNPEERQWSWNLQVGRAVPPGTTGTPLKQYFVQVYSRRKPVRPAAIAGGLLVRGFGWVFGF